MVKKLLLISLLCTLGGCASMQSLPFMGPPPVSAPATPVFFQPFSAALDAPALSTIASVAKTVTADPNARVVVTGAADGIGSARANKYLSETRAQVVTDALIADGVSASRIKTRSVAVAAPGAPPSLASQAGRRALIEIRG